MSQLSQLEPPLLWKYFEEICNIPRTSKHESHIIKYLKDFAVSNNLYYRTDAAGNVVIMRPASPGMENKKTVVLQSHVDMVGEKAENSSHNWLTDPILPYIDNGWIKADGTTLGADDGIGVAAQMAVLTDTNLQTGPIEAVFTVDEETGMTGAFNMSPDFFKGRTMLNLDSEDEGIMFIGCAGGMDTTATFTYKKMTTDKNNIGMNIVINGLHGGHSGDEIHKEYGNAVKIMNRLLRQLFRRFTISINDFSAGNLRNAIAREASASITFNPAHKEKIITYINDYHKMAAAELGKQEKNFNISYNDIPLPSFIMDKDSQTKLLSSITCCPHGVYTWSKDMPGLVETSTNLASIRFNDDSTITIATSQRSSIESAKEEMAAMTGECFRLAGAAVTHSDGYPGWTPDTNSEILKTTVKSYHKLFGSDPVITSIHAGLECGLFYKKFPGIDMISFGPTIKGAHTPDEKIEIKTVKMFWDLLTDILYSI